jgi:hypothetical protein
VVFYSLQGGDICLLRISDSTVRKIPNLKIGGSWRRQWASDSKTFVVGSNDKRDYIVDTTTLDAKEIPNKQIFSQYPQEGLRSYDGNYTFEERKNSQGINQLLIKSTKDSKETKVDFDNNIYGSVWAPNQNLLAFWGDTGPATGGYWLFVVTPDGKSPIPIGYSAPNGSMPPSWLFIGQQ